MNTRQGAYEIPAYRLGLHFWARESIATRLLRVMTYTYNKEAK